MGAADDWLHMVLAMALEADILEHDHLVIAVGFFEGALQQRHRIDIITREMFVEGPHDTLGRTAQTLAVRILAGPAQERADRRFRLFAGRLGEGAFYGVAV